jgi:cytochrome c-type biogenesis protein CcsB
MIPVLVCLVATPLAELPEGLTQKSEFYELENVHAPAGWERIEFPEASGGLVLRCTAEAEPLRVKLRLRTDGHHRIWLRLAETRQVRVTVEQGTARHEITGYGIVRDRLDWRSGGASLHRGNAYLTLEPSAASVIDCVLVTPFEDYEPNAAHFTLPVDRAERLETALTQVFVYGYVLTALLYLIYFFHRREALGQLATALLTICVVANLAAIVVRSVRGNQLPLGTGWEFSMCFAFGIAGSYAVVERVRKTKLLGALALLMTCGICLYGYTAFEDKGIRGLMPALRNPFWLTVHVLMAVIAYGGLAVACGTALAHLTRLWADAGDGGGLRAWLRSNLPTAEFLERTTYHIVGFSFPFLTLLIITGAVWAQTAWGRWWGWDPKETSAFVAWVVYVGYLHTRLIPEMKGRKSSIIAVLGFVAILVCYVGVNYLPGLHSYGMG